MSWAVNTKYTCREKQEHIRRDSQLGNRGRISINFVIAIFHNDAITANFHNIQQHWNKFFKMNTLLLKETCCAQFANYSYIIKSDPLF